jgi:energy-coupling factor transporter ATP-binding protein EcfA2
VRFDQVWFRYARRAEWTLHTVDATVEPGATVVVLGRNGAGKSTLLQLAAGVLRPVRGAVRDRPRIVGWVPERFPADQPFTPEQYLTRMAALRGLRGTAEVEHWIERLGLAVLVSDHRGEIAGLPDAIRWTVADGTLHAERTLAQDEDDLVVEVAVRRADADDTVARLRADGHRVLGVRPPGAATSAGEGVR